MSILEVEFSEWENIIRLLSKVIIAELDFYKRMAQNLSELTELQIK